MKVSIVISLCDNRYEMLKRSLDTWNKQTFPKEDFELVMVDDANRKDLKKLCQSYKELNFQYVQIDNNKCDKPIKTFIPVLSNNIGFRMAKGEVVVVTGPETLQAEKNVEVSYSMSYRNNCAYGLVFKSNLEFVNYIEQNWENLKNEDFQKLLNIKGARAGCLTVPPHPPAYWYYMAVNKNSVEEIGGVDEEFAAGFCAEDDDFANRMKMLGTIPIFEHKIIGIHQDHSEVDKSSSAHENRRSPEWRKLRERNIFLMRQNILQNKIVANQDHIWGDLKVIVSHEIFGGKK